MSELTPEQVDYFMEAFPSMTYQDVMDMPFKQFRALHQIRLKRKKEEADKMEEERQKRERQNQRRIKK